MLADGFYEWKVEGDTKTPYRFILNNEKPFAFAGLWDSWKNPEGGNVYSFTIITTSPNSVIESVHDRMPVILREEAEKLWIDTSVQDKQVLKGLLAPYPSELMKKYEVSTYVNSTRNAGMECIERVNSRYR